MVVYLKNILIPKTNITNITNIIKSIINYIFIIKILLFISGLGIILHNYGNNKLTIIEGYNIGVIITTISIILFNNLQKPSPKKPAVGVDAEERIFGQNNFFGKSNTRSPL